MVPSFCSQCQQCGSVIIIGLQEIVYYWIALLLQQKKKTKKNFPSFCSLSFSVPNSFLFCSICVTRPIKTTAIVRTNAQNEQKLVKESRSSFPIAHDHITSTLFLVLRIFPLLCSIEGFYGRTEFIGKVRLQKVSLESAIV